MNPGAGLLFFYGLPLVLVVSCVWAAMPLRRRRQRVLSLIMLLAACAAFTAWCGVGNVASFAIVVAPAGGVAVMRLLLDGFSILAERVEVRDSQS